MDRSQVYLFFAIICVICSWVFINTLIDKFFDKFLFLFVSFANETFKKLTKIVITGEIALLQWLIADWTLMLPVDNLEDAIFAKSVPALRYVRIVKNLETDRTLSEIAHYLIYVNFDVSIVLAA